MSALAPPNGKYRSMWKIYGKQMADKEMVKSFREGHDKIKWGDPDRFEEVETDLTGYKRIKYKG